MSCRSPRRAAISFALALGASGLAHADVRPHGGMLRFPDVSKTHIVFTYANDLWVAPRDGGVASPLASPPGLETFARFSADGKTIAFVGNYDGNRDLYTIPVEGGAPVRVSYHPGVETLCDWAPNSDTDPRLLFFTNGLAGRTRQTQLFTVSARGGLPARLPVPYGANGAVSADGVWLAYTPHTIDTRTWKRYRGGMATDIWLFNLKDKSSKKITDWEGVDSLPMWSGDSVYYVSDAGPEHRLNIWAYDVKTNQRKQVTTFADFDVKWPSVGPGPAGQGEIVFQNGASLMLLDLKSGQSKAVEVIIPGDRPKVRTQAADASKQSTWWDISPSAKRAVVQARGDIWTVPAEKGVPRNLTRTSGVAERDPAWSPDGRWIAYFSDASGEYDLYLVQSDGKAEARRLTTDGAAFRMSPVWSPDSKRVAFFDKTGTIFVHTLGEGDAPGKTAVVEKDPWSGDGSNLSVSWSHDSRFLAFALSTVESPSRGIFVYSPESGEKKRLTSAFFNDENPVFDRKGDYLFFTSSRSFSPLYGELDTSFVYPNTQVLVGVPLRTDVKSPWAPVSDEEKWADKKKEDKKDEKNEGDKKDGEKKEGDDAKKDEDADKKPDGDAKKDAAPADDGVSGTWEGTVRGAAPLPPEGAPFTLTLSLAKDNSITGSLTIMGGAAAITGTYEPASKTVTFSGTVSNGPNVTGTLTLAGLTLTGSVSAPEMGVTATVEGKRTAGASETKSDDKKDDSKPREKVEIAFDGFESRAMILPVKNGVFGALAVNDKNDLIYVRRSPQGEDTPASIKIFSLKDEKKEEKNVATGGAFAISADGKKLLVVNGGAASIQDAASGATGKPVVTAGMTAQVDPRAEWRQIFNEAWRLQRDYFYDPNMHGVDWAGMKTRYAAMLEDCASREDVGYVIAEMISELNVGHAYYREGGGEQEPSVNVGLLGCDYELRDGAYRISKIIRGAVWDADASGPLSAPGVEVKEGMYLLAVNGVALDTARDPWAAFLGLAGKSVTITVSEKPAMDASAKDIVVEPLASETDLRYRAWIERRRAYIDEKTNGAVGYIYVPDTGVNGQNDLVRQFYGQAHKAALIIDDRWNGGGQIPTRFIELLNRPATNYWARRDGVDWKWPPDSHQGPKCMLINGLAGSGGDMFPWLFKSNKIGKLIGTRTWGGLVGISGNPGLIDGAGVTVPTFGFYETDGTWGVEGHGVDPDIEVIDDPALMTDGAPGIGDPQLDAAIAHILKEVEAKAYKAPKRPAYPNRSGMGLDPADR